MREKTIFILSVLLIVSVSINLLQVLNFKYTYERIKNNYLKKEKRLLEKAVEQSKEINELKNRIQIKTIKR